ncbi:MAG TPA: SHOCT domain-containing protein [Jiangellaceae bacterium]|nr:SHOCT domain-containing protein [Jiangellaceae bacterium]
MWWNDSSGWWFVMPLLMVVFWVGVIWLVVSVFRGLVARPSGEGGRPERPEEILARRYARGQIDEDEYRRRRDILSGTEHAGDQR